MVRDVGLAEDLAQDALVAALKQWPDEGVPDNPGAWLMATAKHRALDHFRRQSMLTRKHGKLDERNKLLRHVSWKGDEQVLDVGCGLGLVLVGAALKLTTGRATGIDIWQTEDVSGNSSTAPLENARLEGVADKVSVETSDMRTMPFADGAFDVIVSRAAIHNLYQADDRGVAIREIARVLKPGGRAVIADIRHISEYIAAFAAHGCTATRVNSLLGERLLGLVTFGKMQPNTIVVTKAG